MNEEMLIIETINQSKGDKENNLKPNFSLSIIPDSYDGKYCLLNPLFSNLITDNPRILELMRREMEVTEKIL